MDTQATLVVGEEGCTFHNIVNIFCDRVNSVAVFNTWRDFARDLEINPYHIEVWSRDILLNKLTVKDVLHNLLTSWKTEKGNDATLPNLLQHLENVNLNNVADGTRKFFSVANRLNKSGAVFKPTLPNKQNYYIPRTFISRKTFDVKVFSTETDIFVLHGDGIDRNRLSQLAEKEVTDTSTNQVRNDALSVRFILLEHFGDWALLREKTTNPIHLMRHHEGKFHWISTKGNISALQTASDEENQNEFRSEEEFIEEIETDLDLQLQTNQPICISDSPGMGKSLLLASIGRQLQQKYEQRIIAFVVISEFVVKIRALLPKFGNTEEAMLEALVHMLCGNASAQEQLVQILKTPKEIPTTQVELMFDGFDEVSTKYLHLAHECLDILKTNFNRTIRVWVTTRPQHLYDLETRFSILGYNIQDFQEKHQIEFLTSYWNSQGMQLNVEKLQDFSKNCLTKLKKELNKKDEDIAGIPLQCMMIAEVYMQEAHRICDSKNERLESWPEAVPCIDVNSIADLYKTMIEHKIEKFKRTCHPQPDEIANIWPLHIYLALQLIFPSRARKFMNTIQIQPGLNEDYLVNIGILECRGSTTTNAARFIHRTFAEYLVARFFVLYVIIAHSTTDSQNPSRQILKLPKFLFKHALQCSVEKRLKVVTSTHYQCSFKHSVLCHFMDKILGSLADISTKNYISKKSTRYVKDVMYACIHSDFSNIIKFLCGLRYPEGFCINYFDSDILVDATTMASLPLLQFLLQSFDHEPLTANSYTVLHAAVRRGSYTIFEYILKQHNFEDLVKDDKRFQDLVYLTVRNTADNDIQEIKDRVQIITALYNLNKDMINYCDDYKQTPLFARRVNILLLKKLVECGTNLLHVNVDKNTILHKATGYLSPADYYNLLQSIPLSTLIPLLQIYNEKGESSLHLIVKRGLATQNILKTILSNGVDINMSGKAGYTCIFYALKIENEDITIPTVKLLLQNGADHSRVDLYGDSILHYSALEGRINCLQLFLEEKKMNVNQINERGDTPIFKALHNRHSALATVQFLLERGADYKILNSNGNSLLHVAAQYHQLECLQLIINLDGLYINQANDYGDTPLLCALIEYTANTIEIITLLLGKGADRTISNKEGNNVLHHLAVAGRTECFNHFAGTPSIDVNARNCDDDTPLHLVFKNIENYNHFNDDFNSFLHNIEKLLSLGADVTAKNDDGKTPLDIYQREKSKWLNYKSLVIKDSTIRRLLDVSGQDKSH